jgi:hypothetical protein
MIVLHQASGSTIDHYLRGPALNSHLEILEVDSSRHPGHASWQLLLSASCIVVVRYLPGPWLGSIRKLAKLGRKLVFLMDDDLLDQAVLKGLPASYASRVYERITRRAAMIPGLFHRVWVTSDYLMKKYAQLDPVLIPLSPVSSIVERRARIQLVYLGTSVHQQEFLWLARLLELLNRRRSDCFLDVFGDASIRRHFRGLARIRVIHPMDWTGYLEETASRSVDLMLCPLMEHPFNAARSPIKFFDAARLGAVGLYSNRAPYRGFIADHVDGYLLPDDHSTWIAAIDELADDPECRQEVAQNTQKRACLLCSESSVLPL